MGKGTSAPDQSLSVKKAISILRCFSQDKPELGLPELVQITGLPRTVCYRMLVTLEDEGFVERDADSGRYRIAMGLFALGSTALVSQDLRRAAMPSMLRLSEASGDAVCLAVLHNKEALCIDRVDGAFPIQQLVLTVGRSQQLHVGAAPITILAHLSKEFQEEILSEPLPKFTPYTITDPAKIRARLKEIVEQGYAISDEDSVQYLFAIGVPLFGGGGQFKGALSVSGLKQRYAPEKVDKVVALAVKEAAEVSRRLGYTPVLKAV